MQASRKCWICPVLEWSTACSRLIPIQASQTRITGAPYKLFSLCQAAMHSLGVLLLLCAAAAGTQALNNGLSTKPALGFNP